MSIQTPAPIMQRLFQQNPDGSYEVFNEMNRLSDAAMEKFGFSRQLANDAALVGIMATMKMEGVSDEFIEEFKAISLRSLGRDDFLKVGE